MPELQRLTDDLSARGLALVTVVTGGNFERVRSVAARVRLSAPIVIADSDIMSTYHVDSVPWTVVIGKDGKAVQVVRGGQSEEFFRRAVTPHL